MDKSKLLFNDAYEYFYHIVEHNEIFKRYCESVFGIDFSQDGFSDINQIKDLINTAAIEPGYKVLDIGCGNGKMVEYIADQTQCTAYGFDYSENAINNAKARTKQKKDLIFEEGLIGEKQYPDNIFDVIFSVDTMYFAEDMGSFVKQIYTWLKPNGVFIAFYGEGHMKKISADEKSTELAFAFMQNDIPFQVVDYTKEHYELMRHKREVVLEMKELLLENDMEFYYDCSLDQSIDLDMTYEEFKKKYNRFMYIVRK